MNHHFCFSISDYKTQVQQHSMIISYRTWSHTHSLFTFHPPPSSAPAENDDHAGDYNYYPLSSSAQCKTNQQSYKTHKYERIAGLSLSTQPSIAVWSSSIQSRVRWAKSSREEKEPQQPRGGSKEVGSMECEMEMAWAWSKRILPNDLTLPPGCTLPVSVDTHSQVVSRLSALSLSVHRHHNHFLSRLRGLWTHWLPEEEFKGGCRWWLVVVEAEKEMASSSFQIGSRMRIFYVWAGYYFYGGNATNNNMYL